jgi:molybdopterin synthase catalytic subunit
MRIVVTDQHFSPTDALAAFGAHRHDAGACVSFVGLARATDGDTRAPALELQHYPGYTESEIERLAAKVHAAHGLLDFLIIHRVGEIAPGEAIVLVAALSAHRTHAFAAVEEMMDYLKTDAPFWKREWREDGAHWVEPTEQDCALRARHEKPRP